MLSFDALTIRLLHQKHPDIANVVNGPVLHMNSAVAVLHQTALILKDVLTTVFVNRQLPA